MARAHVVADDASIQVLAESWGRLHLVGMLTMFLFITSMIIFACSDDNSKKPKEKGRKYGIHASKYIGDDGGCDGGGHDVEVVDVEVVEVIRLRTAIECIVTRNVIIPLAFCLAN